MASITIRGLDEKVKKALRMQAAANSRSMEAEARQVLEDIFNKAKAETKKKNIGLALYEVSRQFSGVNIPIPKRQLPRKSRLFE